LQQPQKKQIQEIQVLRLVASMMVLISHLQHEVMDQSFVDTANFKPFEPVFWAGGVDLFFIISGFIMYHLSRNSFGKPGAPSQFILRRIVRVAPPYWFFTIAMLCAMVLFAGSVRYGSPSLEQIVGSFLFLPLPDPYGHFYPVLILGWTLNFEMLFYAVFAVGLFFNKSWGMTFVIAALLVLGGLPYFHVVQSPPFAFWANPIVFEFLFGIALAHLRDTGVRVGPLVGWSLFVAGMALMVVFKVTGLTELGGLWRPLWMGLPAFVACAGPALLDEKLDSALKPLMRALVFGGNASFALYLSHPFSINLVALVAPRIGIHSPWLYIVVAGGFAMIVAAFVYLLLERPMTGWLHRRFWAPKPPKTFDIPAVGPR